MLLALTDDVLRMFLQILIVRTECDMEKEKEEEEEDEHGEEEEEEKKEQAEKSLHH